MKNFLNFLLIKLHICISVFLWKQEQLTMVYKGTDFWKYKWSSLLYKFKDWIFLYFHFIVLNYFRLVSKWRLRGTKATEYYISKLLLSITYLKFKKCFCIFNFFYVEYFCQVSLLVIKFILWITIKTRIFRIPLNLKLSY